MNEAIELFEELASATWDRLRLGEELSCRQSEETITDINLLEIKRARLHRVLVDKADINREKKFGIDWEWWIGSPLSGWWRYAVQAKKLAADGRYRGIRHRVGLNYQISLLERYASANGCIPLYCFYNYVARVDTEQYWNCPLPFDEPQLGCTVAPLRVVKRAFKKRAKKTFEALHDKCAVPWRCLVKCPACMGVADATHPLSSEGFHDVRPHPSAPDWLLSEGRAQDVENLPVEWYDHDIEIYPRRIMTVDVTPVGTRG